MIILNNKLKEKKKITDPTVSSCIFYKKTHHKQLKTNYCLRTNQGIEHRKDFPSKDFS